MIIGSVMHAQYAALGTHICDAVLGLYQRPLHNH